ncbi:hypothetical protein [Winogradskyella sp. 4-2091]|uniref:hypothetical protein n=1 Tax=Winogradskyella sp. 4-2091 TaxID=3381659 RepID=UPI003892351F
MIKIISQNFEFLIPVLFAVGIITVLIVSYFFSTKKNILRALLKTPVKPINRIRENEYAKIIGKAKYVHEPLVAPLSGKKCVYYHVIIEQKVKNGWSKYAEDKKMQDFFIESGNELALINATQANKYSRVYLVKDHILKSGFLNDASPLQTNYLKSLNKKSTNLLGLNKTLRYKEGVIELDEVIAIKGIAKWKSLNQPIEGYSYSKILQIFGNEKQKFLLTDMPEALKKDRRL